MIDEKFVFLAIACDFLGGFSYLIDTIKGRVKPHKVSWLFWGVAPLLAFAVQLQQQVGLVAWMTFTVGFTPLLIFFASFVNKKADWKITKFDYICGGLSLVGLGVWIFSGAGILAVIFSIVADGLASLPTIIKSYQAPETESHIPFLLAGIAALITLSTIKKWDFIHYGFALYVFLVCLIVFLLVKFKLGKRI